MLGSTMAYKSEISGNWYPCIVVKVNEGHTVDVAALLPIPNTGTFMYRLRQKVVQGHARGQWQWPDMIEENL